MALNVNNFLPDVFFNDNFISEAGFFNIFDSGYKGINDAELAAVFIETFGRDADDKIIAESFSALQKAVMPFVEKIKGSVGNYFSHFRYFL